MPPDAAVRSGAAGPATARSAASVRARWSALAVRIVVATILYSLAAIICTYPLVLHLADGLLGAPDALLESWVLGWDVHALSTDPLHLYDANIYYPFPLPLTYADPMLTGALMVAPLLLATGNAALADNVLTLASLVLAGLGAYLLVRRLSGSDAGGLVAGGIFAFCAIRQAHLEHVQLLQLGWLPLGLLALHVALERPRRRVAAFGLFALCTIAQALTSFYLAWMMAVAYGVFLVVEALARRTLRDRATLGRLAGALLLAGLVVVGVAWPYARTQQLYHFQWQLDVLRDLSAGPSDYLSVPVQSLVYGPLLGRFAGRQFTNEHILFPGLVTVVLVGVALGRRRLSLEMVRYGLIGLVALVLSFGPLLRLDDNHALPLPYDVLLRWVPAFGVMRVPARWDFLLMLALAVLAGFGLAWLSAAVGRRRGRSAQRVLYGTIGLAMLLEILPWPLPIALVATPDTLPPVYAWLRTQDPSAVVAEVPARGPGGFASFGYEYLSTYHWHPLVNGRSGFDPPAAGQVLDTLDAFPDRLAITHLRSLGVRYLIAHRAALGQAERQRLADADTMLDRLGLRIAASFGDDVVYALAPPSSPAVSLQDYLQLELPSLVSRDVTPSVTATLTNPTAEPLLVGAPQAIGADVTWGQAPGATSQTPLRDLPLFIDPQQEVWLHLPASLGRTPGGQTTRLTIRLTGAVQLEVSREVRVADGQTSLDRSGLAGHLEQVRLPPHLHAGSQVTIDVVVRNTGQAVWLPEPIGQSGTHGAVGVGITGWLDADDRPLPPTTDADAHGHVQWAVSPGQSALVSLPATVPAAPGTYSLVLDMVSELVTWFDQVDGGARTTVPVTIEP